MVLSAAVGVDWKYRGRLFVGLEGFYKRFMDIPLSVATDVPLTCVGADYGSIGEEYLVSSAQSRSYGVELMVKWLVPVKVSLVGSATLYKSEYRSDSGSEYLPSAWDNRYIANISAVYDLPKYWSIGAKASVIGGAPYTPYDEEISSLTTVWDTAGRPLPDYSRYNSMRLDPYFQLDIRVDKDFYFNKWSLDIYVDLQNVTFSRIAQPEAYLSTGVMEMLELTSGTIVPSLGVTVEF